MRRVTTYEAFISKSREEESKRLKIERAWKAAEQRRREEKWSGGFGPQMGHGGRDVTGWLSGNGLTRR